MIGRRQRCPEPDLRQSILVSGFVPPATGEHIGREERADGPGQREAEANGLQRLPPQRPWRRDGAERKPSPGRQSRPPPAPPARASALRQGTRGGRGGERR